MLAHPGQPLDDIVAQHPERPPAKTATVVEKLVELGLVTQLSGTPRMYMAIAPDVAIEGLARARVDEARRAAQAIPALMERFWDAVRQAGASDFIEVVRSESTILQRWAQLESAVSRELRGFDC